MKKIISLALALCLALCLSLPAFAKSDIPEDGLGKDGKIHVYIVGDGEKVLTPGSSFIRYIVYYEESDHLIINMNGKDYVFAYISGSLWEDFKEADSKGTFYNQRIKNKTRYHINDYKPGNGYQFVLHYVDGD